MEEEEEEEKVKPVMKSVIKKGEYSEKNVSELLLFLGNFFYLFDGFFLFHSLCSTYFLIKHFYSGSFGAVMYRLCELVSLSSP